MREIKFDLVYKHENNETSHYVQTLEQLMADNSEWGAYFQGKRKGKFETKLIAKRQWTNFRDKNKVEIYEDDILITNGKKHKVWFSGDAFGLIETNGNFYEYICNLSHLSGRCFEVVGNIYENPELLLN